MPSMLASSVPSHTDVIAIEPSWTVTAGSRFMQQPFYTPTVFIWPSG